MPITCVALSRVPSRVRRLPRATALRATIVAMAIAVVASTEALATPLTFTYQGRLSQQGQPASGVYDLLIEFYSVPQNGAPIAPARCLPTVTVTGGLFTVDVTFADSEAVLDGGDVWMQFYVRPASAGFLCDPVHYTPLTPRQMIQPAPYAGHAQNTRGLYVTDSPAFVGVGRETRITGAERFGVHANTSNFGGMYMSTLASGKPFYGYSRGGDVSAFHYVDGAGDWRLNVDNADRFGVDKDGTVSTFGDLPGQPVLEFGVQDDRIGFWRRDDDLSRIMMSFEAGTTEPHTRFAYNVCINTLQAEAPLHVVESGAPVAIFDRGGADGVVLNIYNSGVAVGNISVSGSTVSYNAFTGSHYVRTDDRPERGMLMSMTGDNRRMNGDDGESVHGVRVCTQANDPAVIGAYSGVLDASQPASDSNPILAMSEGNGDLWVIDSGGGDIRPGDALISADVPGCAMRDDAARFPVGYVVARAAQSVNWASIDADEDGVKRARVAVLFDRYVRQGDAAKVASLEKVLAEQQTQIDALRAAIRALQDKRD